MRILKVSTRFHGNPRNSCWDMDWPTCKPTGIPTMTDIPLLKPCQQDNTALWTESINSMLQEGPTVSTVGAQIYTQQHSAVWVMLAISKQLGETVWLPVHIFNIFFLWSQTDFSDYCVCLSGARVTSFGVLYCTNDATVSLNLKNFVSTGYSVYYPT